MNNVTGGDKLIEKIISDARAEAEGLMTEAQKNADAVLKKGRAEAERIRARAHAEGAEATKAALERAQINAQLESRKYVLKRKRELIDEAFDEAKKRFYELDEKSIIGFYVSLLKKECSGGEIICPSSDHAGLVSAAAGCVNDEGELKGELTLAEPIEACGGFIIKSRGYEKDCTLDAVIGLLKDREQTAVAQILFG